MAKVQRLQPVIGSLPPRLGQPIKRADPFYLTPAWRAFAAEMKRQRGGYCQQCQAKEGQPSAVSGLPVRLIADHRIERNDGGPDFDPLNIDVLCDRCHISKTAKARRHRLGL